MPIFTHTFDLSAADTNSAEVTGATGKNIKLDLSLTAYDSYDPKYTLKLRYKDGNDHIYICDISSLYGIGRLSAPRFVYLPEGKTLEVYMELAHPAADSLRKVFVFGEEIS